MPVTKGAMVHGLIKRIEALEAAVEELRKQPPPKKAAPKPDEK